LKEVADKKQPKKPGRPPTTFMIALPFDEAVKAATEVPAEAARKKPSSRPKKKRR
jgi:hypothetical protein